MRGIGLIAAVSMLVELAAIPGGEPISAWFLGAMRHLDASVTRRILGKLRQADLIESRPGPGGGARLARDPSRISLLDVADALAPPRKLTARQEELFPRSIGAWRRRVIMTALDAGEVARREALAATSIRELVVRIGQERNRARRDALLAKGGLRVPSRAASGIRGR